MGELFDQDNPDTIKTVCIARALDPNHECDGLGGAMFENVPFLMKPGNRIRVSMCWEVFEFVQDIQSDLVDLERGCPFT